MLDDRRSRVLKVLVEEYIRTGKPVSSRAILDRIGIEVSSATIRSDLQQLESYGLVEQPHTSSGRLPTNQGYRFYVDNLSPATLRKDTRRQIDEFFKQVHRQISDVLRDTSTLVSEITTYPTVVVGPVDTHESIRDVRLVPLGGTLILAVAIARSGRVYQEFVDVGYSPDKEALDVAERVIAETFSGKALGDSELDQPVVADLPAMVRRIVSPVREQLSHSAPEVGEVYVGGSSQMVSLWSDISMVQRLLEMLGEEAALIDLMGNEADGLTVRFGADIADAPDMAVVATTYETPQGLHGRVGVIGPMRMDYRRTIRVVELVSEELEKSFGADE